MKAILSIPLLTIAHGTAILANLLLSVLVGRFLGASALGTFALAIGIGRVFFASSDLGVSANLTRQIARDPSAAQSQLSLALSFRAGIIPLAVIACSTLGMALFGRSPQIMGFATLALGLVTIQGLFEATLLSFGKHSAAATLKVVASLCVAASSGIWLLAGQTLIELCVSYALGSLAAVVAYIVAIRISLGLRAALAVNSKALIRSLRTSWPIGLSILLAIAALKAPVLMLGLFVDSAQVGAFAAVDMFVTGSAILQAAVTSVAYPRLAQTFGREPAEYRSVYWSANAFLGGAGLLTAVLLATIGAPLAGALFPGDDFERISELMPIMAWSAPSLLLVHHNIHVFAAANQESANLRLMGAWLALIVVLQLLLIPSGGVVGSAWALLAARTLGLVVVALVSHRHAVQRG